jgi:molecular chaperone GrpE
MNQEENKAPLEEGVLQTEEQLADVNSAELKDEVVNDNQNSSWEEKYKELNDRYLRLYSEFDNFRKRSAKERIDFAKTANADIFSVLLPVLDDFDRAAKASENANEVEPIKEGVKLIHHKFKQTLINKGLEEMSSVGNVFDSDLHEAITSIPVESPDDKGKVIEELERGYQLNGKVIRFAKVIVGS